jgi:integrase
MLRAFIAELASRDLSPASVRRYYAPLRAMLATAYEDDLIVRNPAAGVRVIVKDDRPTKRHRMTPEETQSLLSEIPADYADLTYLMAATGLRISEAFALVWSDFKMSEAGPTLTVRVSKTDAGRRTIPLSPQTARKLIERQTKATAGPIFANRLGRPMDSSNYRREVFNPASERAGVPWATPHSLRHGMASLMADHGYSAAQIALHLGHADGGVLAQRTYIQPTMIDAPAFVDDALQVASVASFVASRDPGSPKT